MTGKRKIWGNKNINFWEIIKITVLEKHAQNVAKKHPQQLCKSASHAYQSVYQTTILCRMEKDHWKTEREIESSSQSDSEILLRFSKGISGSFSNFCTELSQIPQFQKWDSRRPITKESCEKHLKYFRRKQNKNYPLLY